MTAKAARLTGATQTFSAKVAAFRVITTITPERQAMLDSHNHRATEVLPLYSKSGGKAYENIEDRLDGSLGKEDGKAFFEFLMDILKWLPEVRPSIHRIIRHPWFEGRTLLVDEKTRAHAIVSESGEADVLP